MTYAAKISSIIVVASSVLLAASSLANAGTGTVRITLSKAGFVFGGGRARGTLHFHGQTYPLTISGLSFGTIGFGVTRLVGHAHELRSAADIVGVYRAASVSVAVGGGAKVARLQNSNSPVYLQLQGSQAGVELSISVSGMTISLP
jgi:hypothetical protein